MTPSTSTPDILIGYFTQLVDPKRSSLRKIVVAAIAKSYWTELDVEQKFYILHRFTHNYPIADACHVLLTLSEQMECKFLEAAANREYYMATGRVFEWELSINVG